MLLTDGLVRDQEAILRGCYREFGASVPLFGGAAADGWRTTGAYLLGNGRVHTDAVIAAEGRSIGGQRDRSRQAGVAMTGDQACEQALGGHELVGMLTFGCAALRPALGDDGTQRGTERLANWTAGVRFHTYPAFRDPRNQTPAVMALA